MNEKKYFIISIVTNVLPYMLEFILSVAVVGKFVSSSNPILDNLWVDLFLGLIPLILPVLTFLWGFVYIFFAKEKKYIVYGLLTHILYVAFLSIGYYSTHVSRN